MAPKLHDLNWREFGMLVPLVIFVFWIGLHPKPVLDVMHASVDRLLETGPRVMTVEDPRYRDIFRVSSRDILHESDEDRISEP